MRARVRVECKYRPTDNARSILSPIPRLACSNHSTARRSLRWRYFQSRSHGIEERLEIGAKTPRSTWVCVCVASYPEGRKEGSKTWLTVDHRSHQDTSSLPPSLFLSLRFTDRGTPPPSIILLSRETPLSLSLSLILSWRGLVEKKRFPSRLERNYGAGTARSKEKQRGGKIQLRSKRAPKDRTRRKFFHSFSFPFVRVGPATSSLLPQSRAHVCSLGFLIKRREKKRRPV